MAVADIIHPFPLFASGQVIPGWGSGAGKFYRLPDATIESKDLTEALDFGAYYGFANVDGGEVHKMYMAIVFDKCGRKNVVVHIFHKFSEDFYGKILRVCVLGQIDPARMKFCKPFEEDLKRIRDNLDFARNILDLEPNRDFRSHPFFLSE